MKTLRDTEIDRLNIDIIKEYLALNRPDTTIKTSDVIRYALSSVAITIEGKANRERIYKQVTTPPGRTRS